MSDLALVTHEYFESLAQQSFTLEVDDLPVELRVLEIRMLPPPKRRTLSGKIVDAAAARLPFSVFFRSEGSMGLQQGTYSLTPPDGSAAMDIFIVPLGFEDGGVTYEAIFN
jgi:hypothetical protein